MNQKTSAPFKPLVASSAYFSSYIILGGTIAILGPSLPWLAGQTGSRLDQVSSIFLASSFGYMVGSLLGGRLYDRLPGHRIQSLAILLIASGLTLVPLLHSLWFLISLVFLIGILQGALDTGCNTLLTWIHGEKVGPFMNALHFFFGAGAFLAPLIFASVLEKAGGIHWAFWIYSLLALPLAAWFWLLPSPPIRHKTDAGGEGKPVNVLFVLIVLFFVFHVGMELGFGNWIYTFAVEIQMESKTGAAYLTSAFWGAFTLARLLGVFISSRLRAQTILLLDLGGCMAALGILLLLPDSLPALWVGTILMGLSVASIFATGMSFAERHLKLSGVMIGWILVGGGIGGMLSPWLIGQMFERISPRVTMPVLLVNNVIALGLLLALVLSTRKRRKTELPAE